jgi:hypothetical protein
MKSHIVNKTFVQSQKWAVNILSSSIDLYYRQDFNQFKDRQQKKCSNRVFIEEVA